MISSVTDIQVHETCKTTPGLSPAEKDLGVLIDNQLRASRTTLLASLSWQTACLALYGKRLTTLRRTPLSHCTRALYDQY